MNATTLARLGLLIVVVACGSQPLSSTTTSSPAGEKTIESLTVAEIEIENADWMVSAGDKVWTMSDPEFEDDIETFALKAIDLQTNQLAFTVERKKSGCDGLGAANDTVWVCDNEELLRLDAETGDIEATIDFAMSWDQGPIPIDGGGIWVLSRDGMDLVHFDLTGTELGRVEMQVICEQVALFGDDVFVACPESQTVTIVDGDAYSVKDEVEVLNSGLLSAGSDRVWLGLPHDNGGVGWITPDGEVGMVAGSPDLSLGCLLVEGNDIWVRGPDVHLARIDGVSAEVIESFQAERPIGGGCVVRGGGSLWIGSLPFGKVWRLDR